MTACNGFVGWYASQLGPTKYLGRFDLETYLPTIGKGHTWVKSTSDARPKFGDICRHTAFHVGVSLDFDGDVWNHVDAGQGGPRMGRDILKRTRGTGPYDYKKLQGWIDIELYFGASSGVQLGPVPEWIIGYWKVTWRAQAYYYYFGRDGQVKWTQVEPQSTSQPPLVVSDTGNFTIDGLNAVTIRWGSTGSVEKYNRTLVTTDEEMQGTWNGTEPLTAKKM
jgi:hypothetical protein